MNINKDSWNIIQRVIRRYPENKKALAEYRQEVFDTADARKTRHSPTEYKVAELTTAYADRLEREVEAVEQAYDSMRDEEKAIIEERFWKDQNKNTPYDHILDMGYSSRQMRRISKRMIVLTGKNLGEIRQ